MCELFAMSSRVPTDARASLTAFARHGGLEAHHRDGWGIAYYADEDVRLVKDAEPASHSACVRFLEEHPFTSGVVLSHIRKATQGSMAMKNCQPFARELGGRMHVFAHNGDLRFEALRASLPLRSFEPIGETDSEYAFCAPDQSVVLAASVPLTEERGWHALREGELVAVQGGAIVARASAELAVA